MNETTTRTATTVWIGSTGKGRGELLVGSDAFPPQQLSLPGRLNKAPDHQTSPEELLAAAHSACLAMAVGAALSAARHPPEHVRVDAACELGKAPTGGGYRITRMSLNVSAAVPGIEGEEFNRIVDTAALSCPISRALLHNVEIDVDQQLE